MVDWCAGHGLKNGAFLLLGKTTFRCDTEKLFLVYCIIMFLL